MTDCKALFSKVTWKAIPHVSDKRIEEVVKWWRLFLLH
jgi:hypothetical protein